MTVRLEDVFDKDLNRIFDAKLLGRIEKNMIRVKKIHTMRGFPKLKKLKGYRILYRIRIGDYRIGITIDGGLVTFVRCLPRKDFYRVFPPIN